MIRINENARLPPGADTSNTYALRVKCFVCRILCGDRFFNCDASREIDRLVIEIEKLRAEGKR